jgi:hypothetical protein
VTAGARLKPLLWPERLLNSAPRSAYTAQTDFQRSRADKHAGHESAAEEARR